MTKKEGLVTLDALKQSLEGGYATLQELYESVHHPVANDIQDKTDEIMKRSIDIAVMALNFKEIPQDAKRPFAALLYAAADSFAVGDSDDR